MGKDKERQKSEVVLYKEDKSQQCQEPKAANSEKKQQAAEKKEQKQPANEPKKGEFTQFLLKTIGIFLIMLVLSIASYQKGADQKSEEYAVEREELENQKEQLEDKIEEQERQFAEEKDILERAGKNSTYFLEMYDKLQEVSYTKLDNEKVLFVNIPISEDEMLRNEYEIYDNNNVPIYLKMSEMEKIDEDTKLYVHFSGMPEAWTVESISKRSGDVYYFPYTNGSETYYCWKLSTSTLSDRYCVKFNPHNGEEPYYLTLWWPGN